MRPASVLVVDDDRDIRDILGDELRAGGLSTFLAANGVEALDALPRLPRPCFILLDLMMPMLNGEQFLGLVERMPDRSDLHIVVMSASPYAAAMRSRPRVLEVLPKPFTFEQVLALVDALPEGP
jgi:CheY-like chemotaxis protein